MTTVSLIVAVYKQVDFLGVVLDSIDGQSFRDFEVIIAEDDESEDIARLISSKKNHYDFSIRHVSHEDRGFRKNRILNNAVRMAEGDYLVFIDGDCVLHKHFLKEHVKRLRPDLCLFGRRAMVDQKTTHHILTTRSLRRLSFFRLLFTRSRRVEDALYLPLLTSFRKFGLKGSNFSLPKAVMMKINGFDEDFEKPFGGEDSDIERRLRLIGISLKCTKFKTIQYHLYHGGREGRDEEWYTEGIAFYQKKIDEGRAFCKNGLTK